MYVYIYIHMLFTCMAIPMYIYMYGQDRNTSSANRWTAVDRMPWHVMACHGTSFHVMLCQGKHDIRFSFDLILNCKVKVSCIHGVQLAADSKVLVRHRLLTQTPKSATFQHSIFNDSATPQHVLQ